jgi:hypothetical protein
MQSQGSGEDHPFVVYFRKGESHLGRRESQGVGKSGTGPGAGGAHRERDRTSAARLDRDAEIAYHARVQAYKSVINRIERARRGIPAGGSVPFGRTFDKKTGSWGVDEDKQKMIADVANRYLRGETLLDLAAEYGTTDAQLGRLLRKRCGPTWTQRFAAPKLGIPETLIETAVPELLDADTIARVSALLDHRRERVRRPPAHDRCYLLSGRIYFAHCGYALTGQCRTRDGLLQYRHGYESGRRERKCPLGRPAPWVRAEVIERAVLGDLLSLLGNPAALERAVRSALPDMSAEEAGRDDLESRLAKVNKQMAAIVRSIGEEVISAEDAKVEMARLHDQRARLQQSLDKVNDLLADLPTGDEVKTYVERIQTFGGGWMVRVDSKVSWEEAGQKAEDVMEELTSLPRLLEAAQSDRRALIDAAFNCGPMPDGKPAGVYITSSIGIKPRQYSYQLCGRLLPDAVRLLPAKS